MSCKNVGCDYEVDFRLVAYGRLKKCGASIPPFYTMDHLGLLRGQGGTITYVVALVSGASKMGSFVSQLQAVVEIFALFRKFVWEKWSNRTPIFICPAFSRSPGDRIDLKIGTHVNIRNVYDTMRPDF